MYIHIALNKYLANYNVTYSKADNSLNNLIVHIYFNNLIHAGLYCGSHANYSVFML